MAVQCPPPAYSVLEGTNGNYEPLRSRLASRGPFGSGFYSESSVEPQTRDPDLKKLPFFNGMEKVIQELDGVEDVCAKMIEKFKRPDGPGSSQSDVSQGSIENTAMKNAFSLAMGAENLSERKREKFTPPVEGHDVIIDLTSEDSCDSRNSMRLDQEPAEDAGQVQSSPVGTSVATGITLSSSDEEDNDDDNADDEEEEDVNVKGSQSMHFEVEEEDDNGHFADEEEEAINGNGSQSLHVELPKPEVQAGSNDPLDAIWKNMDDMMKGNKRENQGVVQAPIVAKGFIPIIPKDKDKDDGVKRRKVNNGDDVSHTIRSDYGPKYYGSKWNNEPSEVVQVLEPVVKPKRGRGRPRKEVPGAPRKDVPPPWQKAPVQVECRDLLEVSYEDVYNNKYKYPSDAFPRIDYTTTQEAEPMVVDLTPIKGKKAAKEKDKEDRRNSDVQREKKGRKKRQNSEELLEEEERNEEEEEECAKSGLEDPDAELNKRTSLLKDEKVDYEPYVRNKHYKEEEGSEYEEEFLQAKAAAQACYVAPPPAAPAVSNECLHPNFDLDDYLGYYCDDCGANNIEMPTQDKKKKEECPHKLEYRDDAGIFCSDCGKIFRDIENLFVAKEIDKGPRKQIQKAQEKGDGSSQVQLSLQGGSSGEEFCGENLQLHPLFEKNLHPHQKTGFKFLTENLLQGPKGSKESMGCVLAHAPGTGKTCLVISFIQSFLTKFPEGKPLILAPKGIVPNWVSEFNLWKVQDIPIFRIGGLGGSCCSPGDGGEDDDEEEEDFRLGGSQGMTLKESRAKFLGEWQTGRGGVLLMSYNMFQILVSNGLGENVLPDSLDYQMSKVLLDAPNLVILDEGHLARNNKTQISQALHRMETKRKVILSGTLFQNNFKELYNLMKLCRDDFMISHPLYQKRITDQAFNSNGSTKHGNGSASLPLQRKSMKELMVIEEKIFTEEIGEKLEIYVRSGETRTEEIEPVVMKLQILTPFVNWYPGEILKSLPGLFEYSLHLKLTTAQMQTIARIPNSNYMSKQCMLSGACIHPSLADKGEDSHADFLVRASPQEKEPHKGVKITFILQLMAKCIAVSERVLIFCTTLSPLHYLEDLFTREYKWQARREIMRLEGSMQEAERQKTIAQFNDPDSHSQVLLASTKACKEGISLVGASRVVILDTTDNPSVVRQAVSRAFRIGQSKKVFVYRLVAEHKDENLIFNRSVNKERLSNVLLDPVATMARLRGFLQPDQSPGDVEDKILKEIMMNDRTRVDDERYIRGVQKYNALG